METKVLKNLIGNFRLLVTSLFLAISLYFLSFSSPKEYIENDDIHVFDSRLEHRCHVPGAGKDFS
jgi:hypothetical protein